MDLLHKYFAIRTFDYLEQSFVDDQLDNFLVTLEGYHQHQAFMPNFIKWFRDMKESTPHIGGWVSIKTLINFMCNW